MFGTSMGRGRWRSRHASRRRAFLEQLEPRFALAAFVVSTTADTVDVNPGDGIAADSDGQTSLRAAIMEANWSIGADTIELPAGRFMLTQANQPDLAGPEVGDLDVLDTTGGITITGAGPYDTVIDAGGTEGILDRVFYVGPAASLLLAQVTVTGGVSFRDGGGILNEHGSLEIRSSVISSNTAAGFGGGIFSRANSTGLLRVQGSTVAYNYSQQDGGGVFVEHGPRIIVEGPDAPPHAAFINTTMSGNAATGRGGAMFVASSNSLGITSLVNCTVTQNVAELIAGGLQGPGEPKSGEFLLLNTIVAANGSLEGDPDLNGLFNSRGHNLIGNVGSAAGFADGVNGDLVGNSSFAIDPGLGILQPTAGSTPTHSPLFGSPAIDAADTERAPLMDQRGFHRPQDGDGNGQANADIGAVEIVPGNIVVTKWNDLNGDGIRGLGEPGLSGWTFLLYSLNGIGPQTEPRVGVTDQNGLLQFAHLVPGAWFVLELPQDGWFPTSVPNWVPIADGESRQVDFGNAQLATIHGVVWDDLDGDGIHDAQEPGLDDWNLDLQLPNGALVNTVRTDANGSYAFTDVFPGAYVVSQRLQPDYEPTYPARRFDQSEVMASGTIASSVLIADLDGNQANDLVISNDFFDPVSGRSGLSVMLNDEQGGFADVSEIDLRNGARVQEIIAVDYDFDQDLDLFATTLGDPRFPADEPHGIVLLRNLGGGVFAPPEPIAAGDGPMHIVAADFDGDGRIDLATANLFSGDLSIVFGLASDGFAPPLSLPMIAGPVCLDAGDLNHDSWPDLVVANEAANQVTVLLGQPGRAFVDGTPLVGLARPADVDLADFDSDGHLDLAVTTYGSNQVTVFRGDGSGSFRVQQVIDVGRKPQHLTVGDVDGDGVLDFAVANEGDGTVSIALNSAEGRFAQPLVLQIRSVGNTPASPQHVSLGDLDRDGDLDLAVAHFAMGISIYYNELAQYEVTVTFGDALVRNFGNQQLQTDLVPAGLLVEGVPRDNHRHNYVDAIDVNGDGQLSPIDPLMIINLLNTDDPQSLAGGLACFPDVNGDRLVAPNDVLQVVNELNLPGAMIEQRPLAFRLTDGMLNATWQTALGLWANTGIDTALVQRLQSAQIEIVDLPGNAVGRCLGGTVLFDATAAGFGWRAGSQESAAPADERVDLLTAVMHEMGHVLGLVDDERLADSLMHPRIRPTSAMLSPQLADEYFRIQVPFT